MGQRSTFPTDLDSKVYEITFTKADKTKRTMICTLREDLIPAAQYSCYVPPEKYMETVWDLEKNNWRNIIKENVINSKETTW